MDTIKQNKGISLIELILYMSIFMFVFTTVISSTLYIQKMIQNNNYNYYVKNQFYMNFDILQQYLYRNRVEFDGVNIYFFDKNNVKIFTQNIENNNIKNIYRDKDISILEGVSIKQINIEFLENNRLLSYSIYWLDQLGKERFLTEHFIVINQNM